MYANAIKFYSVREGLRDHTIVPKPTDWPLFMYENFEVDENDLTKGWLKSNILINVSSSDFARLLRCNWTNI